MKITTLPIIVMFLASALILPVGISYAAYGPGFTTGNPTVQTMTNQTSANQTSTPPAMNKTMTMPPSANQTSTTPAMNHTMTMPPSANQTSTTPAMNHTMTMPPSANQTSMPPVVNPTIPPANSTSSPPVTTKSAMLLPLQQVKSGVAPKDVQCKSGFTLIFKAEDGSPACVDPTVAQVLAQRGW